MASICLLDSSVLVYAHDPRERVKGELALVLLEELARRGGGSLSPQVLGEFYVNLRRVAAPVVTVAEADTAVRSFMAVFPVWVLRGSTVVAALDGVRTHRLSYWDALIWATARENGLAVVLSEDFTDGLTIEGVTFRNPFLEGFDLEAALR
jgi:predicted nucleic acid-binding protein